MGHILDGGGGGIERADDGREGQGDGRQLQHGQVYIYNKLNQIFRRGSFLHTMTISLTQTFCSFVGP